MLPIFSKELGSSIGTPRCRARRVTMGYRGDAKSSELQDIDTVVPNTGWPLLSHA
jgi:hypothetical protein